MYSLTSKTKGNLFRKLEKCISLQKPDRTIKMATKILMTSIQLKHFQLPVMDLSGTFLILKNVFLIKYSKHHNSNPIKKENFNSFH